MNSLHPRLKFEIEKPTTSPEGLSLSLLDFKVTISANGESSFEYYKKPAQKPLFVHHQPALPRNSKINFICNERKCICCSSIFAFGTIFSEPVQNFWTSTKFFEPVQKILNQYKIFWTGSIFFCFCFCVKQNKKIVWAPSIFILPLLFISTLLTSLTIPFLLSQHPSPYSFYLNAYLVSLEPQTFGFPLDSCPDALPLSHEDLDASSPIFLITYTQ